MRPQSIAQGRDAYRAKNVIVMISDGCGYNHIAAAGLYKYGKTGEMPFEEFPVKSFVSTYPAGGSYDPSRIWSDFNYASEGTTDSAAAATAIATGHKTYDGAIGVLGSKEKPEPVQNAVERAEELGRSTGVITTVTFSHATPAGFVAHNPSRDNYEEIAREMLLKSKADVVMGSGNPYYDYDGKKREKPSFKFVGGEDTWNAVCAGTAGADADGDGIADPWKLIQSREEFTALGSGPAPKRLLGVPCVAGTLQQGRGGNEKADPYIVPRTQTVPTLAEMTRAAVNVLDDNKRGFFLMIEGGSIDSAAHSNESGRMIEEEIDFADAVHAVIDWVDANSSWDDTLLIVTADHETGYLTGPGSGPSADGKPVWNPIVANGAGKLPGMEWHSGDHTNSLVPIFARGRASAALERRATWRDPVRGAYLDNTDIAKTVFEVMQ